MAGWDGLLPGLPGKDESWLLSHHRLTGRFGRCGFWAHFSICKIGGAKG